MELAGPRAIGTAVLPLVRPRQTRGHPARSPNRSTRHDHPEPRILRTSRRFALVGLAAAITVLAIPETALAQRATAGDAWAETLHHGEVRLGESRLGCSPIDLSSRASIGDRYEIRYERVWVPATTRREWVPARCGYTTCPADFGCATSSAMAATARSGPGLSRPPRGQGLDPGSARSPRPRPVRRTGRTG